MDLTEEGMGNASTLSACVSQLFFLKFLNGSVFELLTFFGLSEGHERLLILSGSLGITFRNPYENVCDVTGKFLQRGKFRKL